MCRPRSSRLRCRFRPVTGLHSPAGLPQEVADAFAEAIRATVENPEFRQIMEERGFTLDYLSPADSEAFVRNELATLTALYEELPWK